MAALLALAIAVGAAGCGEDEGVAEGATVRAYVERPLCQDDVSVIAMIADQNEALDLKLVCLPSARGPELGQGVGAGREVDLAQAGANARLASEDSAAILYVAPGDPGVARFTHPILAAAGIGWLTASSRREVRLRLPELLSGADTDDLRADLRDELGQG